MTNTIYTGGTVTVSNGSPTVTGSGTTWAADGIREGDLMVVQGRSTSVLTVNSNTSITLAADFRGGSASGEAYEIVLRPTADRNTSQITNLLAQLGNGTLENLSGLSTGANLLPYFTGANVWGTTAFTSQARSLLDDPSFAAMRSTLGLVTQTSSTDNTSGRVLLTGAFGLGSTTIPTENDWDSPKGTGWYRDTVGTVIGKPFSDRGHMMSIRGFDDAFTQIAAERTTGRFFTRSADSGGTPTDWFECATTRDFVHNSATVTDLDDATQNGFYQFADTAANRPFASSGTVIVTQRGAILTQMAMRQNVAGNDLLHMRTKFGTTWSDWFEVWNGANVVSGSNSNGDFIRYPNGFQICWNSSFSGGEPANVALGDIFRSETQTWDFPATFSGIPAVSITSRGLSTWSGNANFVRSDSVDYLQFSGTSNGTVVTSVRALAVGYAA